MLKLPTTETLYDHRDDPTTRHAAQYLVRDFKRRRTAIMSCTREPRQLHSERVFIVGEMPGLRPLAGWTRSGHYAEAERQPVQYWTHDETGFRVEIARASSFFGDASPDVCGSAWDLLHDLIGRVWPGAPVLMSTPGATGLDLIQRSFPRGARYTPPPAYAQELIRSTAGQGRIEITAGPDPLPDLYELDGRLMYLGLLRELPTDLLTHRRVLSGRLSLELLPDDPHERGRYLVALEVPEYWRHVGLVGMQTGRGWTYPNRPGGHFTTWVDGAELAMIRRWWGPASIRGVWEAMTFRHGRPLDNYARRLMRLLAAIDDHETAHATTDDAAVYAAARRAVRSIALHSIGSLTGKPRRVTRSQPITYGPPPVGAVHARLDGGEWRWSETGPPRQPALAQPQMAAAVWARARTRLLDGPAVDDIPTGALHVPRGWVVGFRTDAIYLTHDPRWPDDGRPGRYRRKTTVPGPMVAPTNQTQLLALRDGAF